MKNIKVVIDGIDGSGKSTIVKLLNERCTNIDLIDRGVFTKLTLQHWDLWPKPDKLDRDWDVHIILEVDISIAVERLTKRGTLRDKWESDENLFLFRHRYRTLSAYYGQINVVDTSKMNIDQVYQICCDIIYSNNTNYLIPCIENFTDEQFEKLPKVIEGESKIVKSLNNFYDIVKYKPTVYSHKMQRAGIVEGTDSERMTMTKHVLDILSRSQIKHCYWYVGETYILTEKINNQTDIPPLEVIVKRCFVGSDKHRYFNMEKCNNRFGAPLVKDNNEYQKLLVRFDYRNPNFHPETGLPIGDILVCDDLADEFINVEVAKETAIKIFKCLDQHFKRMNIYFEDVCLMLVVDGDKLYGEISQDCGRYKYIKEDELTDLDKDVWRAGGSSQLVLQKYQMLSKILKDYILTLYDEDKKLY